MLLPVYAFLLQKLTNTRSKNKCSQPYSTSVKVTQDSLKSRLTNRNLLIGGLKLKDTDKPNSPNLILPQSPISGNGNSILLATQTQNHEVIFVFSLPSTLCLIQQNHLVISTFKTSEKPTTLINSTASPWPKPSPLLKLHYPSFPTPSPAMVCFPRSRQNKPLKYRSY